MVFQTCNHFSDYWLLSPHVFEHNFWFTVLGNFHVFKANARTKPKTSLHRFVFYRSSSRYAFQYTHTHTKNTSQNIFRIIGIFVNVIHRTCKRFIAPLFFFALQYFSISLLQTCIGHMKAGAISLDFSRAALHQCSEMATFLKSFSRPQCRPHTQRPIWAFPLPIVPPAPSSDQGAPALFHARSNHLPISSSTDEATPGPGTATHHAGCSQLPSTRLGQNNSSPLRNHSGKGTMGEKAHGHLLMHPELDKWHLSPASLELARDCTALEH